MSILLSVYWKEGIVYSADRNLTLEYETDVGPDQDVLVGASTKVIPWPRKKAVVGFIGLGRLAGLRMEEWMRQFVAKTRDHGDLDSMADELRELIQVDFHHDYPMGTDVGRARLIAHLGGFKERDGVVVPAMYCITNMPDLLTRTDIYPYPPATRHFALSDLIADHMPRYNVDYPSGVRDKLIAIVDRGDFWWVNHGVKYPTFNRFKSALWEVLRTVEKEVLAGPPTIEDRARFCEMAVRVYGLFFEQYYRPKHRTVGGGADTEWIPWPD